MYQLLIVDDEVTIRTSLANYFPWVQEGFVVAGICADGREAIRFLDGGQIDVLLIDIMMPHVTGIEVARYIYEKGLRVKVVLLSAHGEFSYAQTSMRYGVKYYVLKPTKYEELKQIFSEVREALDQENGQEKEGAEETDVVERMRRYIDENCATATLEEISELFHLNLSYISRLFKKKMSVNFTDYVTQVRMEKARRLLNDSDCLISEVCVIVGYSDPRSFSKAFKKYFGVSPRDFRGENAKTKEDDFYGGTHFSGNC